MGKEMGSNFYNEKAKKNSNELAWKTYKDLYHCIVEFLSQVPKNSLVLDLGCGRGCIAYLLYKKGFKNYVGIDFSSEILLRAKEQVPKFKFVVADIKNTETYEPYKECRVFIVSEVLEHIIGDIQVLEKLPQDSLVVFSVPSYSAEAHVRYFRSSKEVKLRYNSVLDFNKGESKVVLSGKGHKIFVFSATRKDG